MAAIFNAVVGAGVSYVAPVIISCAATNFIASAGAIAVIGGACATYQQMSSDGIVRWCVNKAKNRTSVVVPATGLVVVLDGNVVPRDRYVIFDSANAPDTDTAAENGWVIM